MHKKTFDAIQRLTASGLKHLMPTCLQKVLDEWCVEFATECISFVMYCTVHLVLEASIELAGDHMRSKNSNSSTRQVEDLIAVQGRVAIRMGSQSGSNAMISVVHPAGLSSETQQTSGSLRMSAIAAMNGIVSSLWAGIFVVEPSGKTGIHHHGEQDTVVYVLEGEACVRWGDSGEYSLTVGAGDFLHVPSWLPHQEFNPSRENPFRWVVVRSTPEPIVVNLPDDFWRTA
jgi:uncharacterized RmlC-like cupin family protein